MRFFNVYQYLGPAVLLPLAGYLWWRRLGDPWLVAAVVSIPVVFAYVIPGVGTNVLGLWEINTRLRLGRFRPHHGFVFGSAASLLALLAWREAPPAWDVAEVLRAGFVVGSVLAFWNWLYDVHAVAEGFIVVYNRRHYEGARAEVIVGDYAPVFFGAFGFAYGVALELLFQAVLGLGRWDLFWPLVAGCHLFVLATPVAAYAGLSYLRHGDSGLLPWRGEARAP